MRFTKFEIRNFKGAVSLDLDLVYAPNSNIFTLVGLNESGKTTILEAINMLQNDIPEVDRHKLIPRSQSSNFNGNVSITATLELEDGDEDLIKQYAVEKHDFYLEHVGKKLKVTRCYIFVNSDYKKYERNWDFNLKGRKSKGSQKVVDMHDKADIAWDDLMKYIASNFMPRIIYYPHFLFDFPEKIYLNGKEDPLQSRYKISMQDILDSLKKGHTLSDSILERMKVANSDPAKKKALEATLKEMSIKVTSTVIKPWDSIFSTNKSGADIKKEVKFDWGEEPSDTPEAEPVYYLTINVEQGSEIYQVEERSLGFKWFFAFLMFTQFRKNRSTDRGETLFLVDEPASNLHSSMQKRLSNEIENIVDKSKLIFTTHSHHLIKAEWLETTYVVQNKALNYAQEMDFTSSETDVDVIPYKKFVAIHPNQKDYYQPVLDALDYEPSDLEMVDPITVVEGKNDYYTYKYVHDIVMKRDDGIKFYPGNGAGGNEYILRLYLAWGRKFNVLLDSDYAGVEARNKYIDEISIELESRIYTINDAVASWSKMTPELLFSAAEQLKIVQMINPRQQKYGKKNFNLSIQTLLFERKPIVLSKSTLNKFEKIFEVIKVY